MKRVLLMVSLSLFPRLLAAQELDITPLIGKEWYGLYLNGQKAGYAYNAVDVEKNGTMAVTEDAHFRIRMSDVPQDMRIYLKRVYGKDGALLRIEQEVEDAGGVKKLTATVEGDALKLVTDIGGAAKEQRLPKPKESLKDALKQLELVGKDAGVGRELSFATFEPMYEREVEGVSRIEAIEERILDGVATKVFKIRTVLKALGIDSVAYVTDKGITLEDHIAEIITMRLEPKEVAQDVNYSTELIVSNAARVDQPIENPRDRAALELRITGPLTPEHLFNDERQALKPDGNRFAFVGRKISLDGFSTAKLPVQDESVKAWLKPTLYVQSEDPKLVRKAREIVGDETDTFAISTKLCHWVYEHVRTTFSARLTNALEVLEHPEGDCTEHSILFIGLARAAGVPAREVAGLIYVGDQEPGFYFHQWAKVWVGKWIDVDPTFNQPIADATHIKLAEGDLFEQAKLIPTIGQLGITVDAGPGKETQ